jgi:hypothetical protein
VFAFVEVDGKGLRRARLEQIECTKYSLFVAAVPTDQVEDRKRLVVNVGVRRSDVYCYRVRLLDALVWNQCCLLGWIDAYSDRKILVN